MATEHRERPLLKELLRSFYLGLLTGSVICLSGAPNVQAEGDTEEVISITSTEDVVAAYGVVFGPFFGAPQNAEDALFMRQRGERREAEVREKGKNRWDVVVKLKPTDYSLDNQLTAIATTRSGKVLASRVRALSEGPLPGDPHDVGCGDDLGLSYFEKLFALDDAKLAALIDIRKQKRDLLQQKLGQEISPELAKSIVGWEQERGLGGEGPFSPRSPASTLTRRLVTLEAMRPAED